MNYRGTIALLGLSIGIAPILAQGPENRRDFEEAERRIVRLPPAAFPELPANLRRELMRRGCTIPQEGFTKKPHNIIRCHFARPGQMDWAVLCSVRGFSSILVFWNGSEKNAAEVAPLEDRIFLQTITADEIGYSRGIQPVQGDFIRRHHDAYGGPQPPPIDHEGIDDAFIQKASVVHYFHRGEWLKLTGAD